MTITPRLDVVGRSPWRIDATTTAIATTTSTPTSRHPLPPERARRSRYRPCPAPGRGRLGRRHAGAPDRLLRRAVRLLRAPSRRRTHAPRIAAIGARAGSHAGHPFDNCLANLYETGDNTMGFHQDSYDGLTPGSAIAIVSLGATRCLAFRSLDRNHHHELALAHGSVLLMTAVTQRGWTHAVPREPAAGPRVSLTFRQAMTRPTS
ncbi:alpha-ketoglutarate-dependent dioxygenase AlkB [Embleya sp. NPDC020630]|uniref:alpha-ketoglutarate-dependent dioxygenase AlkB n=1 Tax=Embleya sp. NPDC020630 TaxID=3363979 RepID=UPI0037984F1A